MGQFQDYPVAHLGQGQILVGLSSCVAGAGGGSRELLCCVGGICPHSSCSRGLDRPHIGSLGGEFDCGSY